MLSRRQFLGLAGIGALSFASAKWLSADSSIQYARTLAATPVQAAPQTHAPLLRYLWPDTIVSVLEIRGDWLRCAEGYIERAAVQPMLPYQPQPFVPHAPFWAETAAPVAPVLAWAAADAPLLTRIGHLGVMYVVDTLPNGWYGVAAADGQRIGWTQAHFWRVLRVKTAELRQPRLDVDLQEHMLHVYDAETIVLQAPVSGVLPPGIHTVRRLSPGGVMHSVGSATYHGVPYRIELDNGGAVCGAYWHNHFGTPLAAASEGMLHISPLLARWLYWQVCMNTIISVRPKNPANQVT